LDLHCLL